MALTQRDAAGMAPRAEPLLVKVYDRQRLILTSELNSPLELGRQRPDEPAPPCRRTQPGLSEARIIVARLEETTVSRSHARLEPLTGGDVRITNLSHQGPIRLEPNAVLGPGESLAVQPPCLFRLGDKTIRLETAPTEDLHLAGLAQPTLPPGQSLVPPAPLLSLVQGSAPLASPKIIPWLRSVLDVSQSAASSADFLPKAVAAVAQIVGLDRAAMVRRRGDEWVIETACTCDGTPIPDDWHPSRTMLAQVLSERRTFRHVPECAPGAAPSLVGITALVAAPILDAEGNVVGAMYGDRRWKNDPAAFPTISELEAMLVELLASGVAAGLARLNQEQVAVEARVRLEQFFTPQLARKLEVDRQLLVGRDALVTILFCDFRGFSRISERLGPQRTVAWISDAMGEMSESVLKYDGVLVDYIGDELMAMWGAPDAQQDHARLACLAAQDMMQHLPELSHRWREELGEPIGVRIGINSGVARVGNTGTVRKFKYSPVGNTVNLASRVLGASKHVKADVLLSGTTAAELDRSFAIRRLCRVRVVNIAEPVDLFELKPNASPEWSELAAGYQAALEAFERREFRRSMMLLGSFAERFPDDGPTLILMSRAIRALAEQPDPLHPVWELSSK